MDRTIKEIREVTPMKGKVTEMMYIQTIYEDGSVDVRTEKPYENIEEASKDWATEEELFDIMTKGQGTENA